MRKSMHRIMVCNSYLKFCIQTTMNKEIYKNTFSLNAMCLPPKESVSLQQLVWM